jgi:ADP-ribosylglycohydrolase
MLKEWDFEDSLLAWGRRYPHPMGAYGAAFGHWLASDIPEPYYSYGNGAIMRVSPCGWAPTAQLASEMAKEQSAVSHNHPEALKAAEMVALFILYLRKNKHLGIINIVAHAQGVNIPRMKDIKPVFDETCQGTLPVALACVLESTSFEDAIRNAVSVGGDTDTIAAVVGGIAEAYYGVPEDLREKAMEYLTEEMKEVIMKFEDRYGK